MKGLIKWVSDLVVCLLTQDLDCVSTTRYKIAALFLCCQQDFRPSKWDRNSGCLGRWNKSGTRHQGRAELFSLWITVHFHIHVFTGTFIWEVPHILRPLQSLAECILLVRSRKYLNWLMTPLEELRRHHAPAPAGWIWCPVRSLSMLIRKNSLRGWTKWRLTHMSLGSNVWHFLFPLSSSQRHHIQGILTGYFISCLSYGLCSRPTDSKGMQ